MCLCHVSGNIAIYGKWKMWEQHRKRERGQVILLYVRLENSLAIPYAYKCIILHIHNFSIYANWATRCYPLWSRFKCLAKYLRKEEKMLFIYRCYGHHVSMWIKLDAKIHKNIFVGLRAKCIQLTNSSSKSYWNTAASIIRAHF